MGVGVRDSLGLTELGVSRAVLSVSARLRPGCVTCRAALSLLRSAGSHCRPAVLLCSLGVALLPYRDTDDALDRACTQFLEYLVGKCGVDVNGVNRNGFTPLTYAVLSVCCKFALPCPSLVAFVSAMRVHCLLAYLVPPL